jgi:phosphoribosylaminoimidazole-succinocarboxamide synthase
LTAANIVGSEYASRIASLALTLYKTAHAHALSRGLIIADTKFDEVTDKIVLADEVLTPDSSRFWHLDRNEVGRGQESFDKQFLRDWLASKGLKGKEDVVIEDEVVSRTEKKYREAYEMITGERYVV